MNMKRSKKILALFVSLLMLLTAFSVAPVAVKAESAMAIQIFDIDDMSVASGSTNLTFNTRFLGGVGPYTVVWQQLTTAGDAVWTDVYTGPSMSAVGDISYTIPGSVTADMNGYRHRVRITDSESSVGYSNEALLTVTTAAGTNSAPTIATNATPANNGTVYRNQGLQIQPAAATGSAYNSNARIYYNVGWGTGAAAEIAATVADPTMASTPYTGPIVVPDTITNGQIFVVKAICTSSLAAQSPVATFTWTASVGQVATLWDIKKDPQFILWRDSQFDNDVPGVTYKTTDYPLNGVSDYNIQSDPVPAVVYDKVTEVIARMTAAEKSSLLHGSSGKVAGATWGTRSLLQYGIMSSATPDGPNGDAITAGGSGTTIYQRRNTWFPAAITQAAGWNKELTYEFGKAWGYEMAFFGIDMMLGPGMNLHRTLLGGRNFEYYSEDPYHSGTTAGTIVQGVKTNGVSMVLKHYLMNNQDTGRTNRPTYASTRAIREIYARNFEYAIEMSNPWSIMDSFNNVNGPHATQHYDTNTTLARVDFGFNGWIMTDYGSSGSGSNMYNYTNANASAPSTSVSQATRVKSGCEVMNPGTSATVTVTSGASWTTNTLSQDEQNIAVRRMLYYAVKTLNFNDKQQNWGLTTPAVLDYVRPLAKELGSEGIVLVKNDEVEGKVSLPLARPTGSERILMVGSAHATRVNGGTGSGQLTQHSMDVTTMNSRTLLNETRNRAGGTDYVTSNNSDTISNSQWNTWSNSDVPYTAVIMSIRRAQGEFSDVVTSGGSVTVGYRLQTSEQTLIRQAADFADAKGIPFILVMNACNFVDLNAFVDRIDAIVIEWYQGFQGAIPVSEVLFGDINPSGKLPTTWPIAVDSNYPGNGSRYSPVQGQFGTSTDIYYHEDMYYGYRYYDTFNVPVIAPYGHGLSYTTFEYSDLNLDKTAFNGVNDKIKASVKITNTGDMAGKEVVQFYIGAPGIEIDKPVKELKEFDKTKLLQPGESETIEVEFDAMALASYYGTDDEDASVREFAGQWRVEQGHYVVYFGASSKDIKGIRSFNVPEAFTAKTVVKPAAAVAYSTALGNLQNPSNMRRPTQITVTFQPNDGTGNFTKSYTYNDINQTDRAPYGYLPVMPTTGTGYIYEWYSDSALSNRVYATTAVPTEAATLYAKLVKAPIEITNFGDTVTASVTYANDSAEPTDAMSLVIGLYDSDGKLIAINYNTQTVEADGLIVLDVSLPVEDGAATAKAFLWDGDTFVPLLESALLNL